MVARLLPRFAALLGAGLLSAHLAAALTAGQRCEVRKLTAAGKYGVCRLKADAKVLKTGGSPDYSVCDDRFGIKWARAERTAGMGVCPSEGDQSALQAFVTGHTDDVAGALAGGPLPNCAGDLATCNSDLAAALACGNGAMNVNEDCDQANLDGQTCLTQGFAGGTLACSSGCLFDTSGCWLARFTDNADGTITDNEVGLMWEKKTELDGSTNFPNAHDADNHYPWAGVCSLNTSKYCQPTADAATLCAANAEGGTVGCDECTGGDGPCSVSDTVWTWAAALDTAAFAAHNDWRLPKRRELEGILDLAAAQPPAVSMAFQGPSCGGACTDIRDPACSCTWSANYWSASAYAAIPGAAWILYFGDGSLEVGIRTNDFYVRAVRSVP